jgi:hypothetical protein
MFQERVVRNTVSKMLSPSVMCAGRRDPLIQAPTSKIFCQKDDSRDKHRLAKQCTNLRVFLFNRARVPATGRLLTLFRSISAVCILKGSEFASIPSVLLTMGARAVIVANLVLTSFLYCKPPYS